MLHSQLKSYFFGGGHNGDNDRSWSPEWAMCIARSLQYPRLSYPTKQQWHGISITFNFGLRSHYVGTDQTALFNLQAASSVPSTQQHSRCLFIQHVRADRSRGNFIMSGRQKMSARCKVQPNAYMHKDCLILILAIRFLYVTSITSVTG